VLPRVVVDEEGEPGEVDDGVHHRERQFTDRRNAHDYPLPSKDRARSIGRGSEAKADGTVPPPVLLLSLSGAPGGLGPAPRGRRRAYPDFLEDLMSAEEDRKQAEKYAEGDLLWVLYRQHAEITEALERVAGSKGEERTNNLAAAVAFMKRHETAEQNVVRPIVTEANQSAEAEARNAEEKEADGVIAELTILDVDSSEFETKFAALMQAVSDHAETEETDEFPIVETARSEADRITLGEKFLKVEASS
jgi:hypothetical protein